MFNNLFLFSVTRYIFNGLIPCDEPSCEYVGTSSSAVSKHKNREHRFSCSPKVFISAADVAEGKRKSFNPGTIKVYF